MKKKIDFVIMWVDGNDLKWQQEKNKYDVSSSADGSIYRYRDWDMLKYWFRGVEKYAPWVNQIYFVTWGHIPDWLDTKNPKLNIVNHKDFIPKEYLPTFSANTIELNLHRIEGLSSYFVLFNDDSYVIGDVDPDDFFKDGFPRDNAILNVHCPQKSLKGLNFGINDVSLINEHFNMKNSIKGNFTKWFNLNNGLEGILKNIILFRCPRFPGFWQHHLPSSFLKSTFEEVWTEEHDVLNTTCSHKFRENVDVNQWLMKEWQIASGKFMPRNRNMGKSFNIDEGQYRDVIEKVEKYIMKNKGKLITINDGPMKEETFQYCLEKISDLFERKFPNKSKFEK